MKTHDLRLKVQSALDQIDDAVLAVLIQSNQPLHPKDICNELDIPRTSEYSGGKTPTAYPTIRDSLFRLLASGKVKRTPKVGNRTQRWFVEKSKL